MVPRVDCSPNAITQGILYLMAIRIWQSVVEVGRLKKSMKTPFLPVQSGAKF
ncbi:MAG: hypothetical protein SCK70_07120 [bacterium]|nr:hypothetical protein [bacterium]